MAKRRGNSEGTVYFHEPSGRWTGQVTVGRHPVSGKPVRKTVYGETQQEALRKVAEIRQNPPVEASNQKLSTALDFWLGSQRTRVDPQTAVRYEQELRPVRQLLGQIALRALPA